MALQKQNRDRAPRSAPVRHLPALALRAAARAVAAYLAASSTGCAPASSDAPHTGQAKVPAARPASLPTIVVIADTSPSNLPRLGQGVGAYADLLPLLPEGTWERFYRIDSGLRRIRNAPALASADEFLPEAWPLLSAPALNPETHLHLAIEEAELQARAAEGSVFVLVFTDWACEGENPEARARLRRAVARLAKNGRLKGFAVVGADPLFSRAMAEDLAPLPSGLLHTVNLKNADLSFVAEALRP